MESHASVPFAAQGRNLDADARLMTPPVGATAAMSASNRWISPLPASPRPPWPSTRRSRIEADRIDVASASIATGKSRLNLAGQIENLADPHGKFDFRARIDNGDAERIFETKLLDRGTAEVKRAPSGAAGAMFPFPAI
jgi:hypothetical protein